MKPKKCPNCQGELQTKLLEKILKEAKLKLPIYSIYVYLHLTFNEGW
ncbi:hypothetical protein IQ231_00065 [Cuspidothrix issatschenkoi LEGE 03284]|nr:hypothetical protein [Cuspidothrix issatschenkoi]MBE9230133.1 hypothetical protein [Cuspidothrix issatschenkoi LEGE 03284]